MESAAQTPSEGEDVLPALVSSDGTLIVHFARNAEGCPLRACMIRKQWSALTEVRIGFPAKGLAFSVNERGEVDLPGIEEADLAAEQVMIEIRVSHE